jgi:hypothetical protein
MNTFWLYNMAFQAHGYLRVWMYIYSSKQATPKQSSHISWHWRSFRRRQRPTTAVSVFEVDQPGHILSGCIPRIPSWASLLTSTTAASMALFLPLLFVCSCKIASLSIVSQHRRSFVFKVLVKELSIRSIIIRWRNPFPWYDAWESYAYASGAVDPGGRGTAGELLAEVGGEVVAIFSEEVVRGSLEFYGRLLGSEHFTCCTFLSYLVNDGFELLLRPE